MEKNHSPFAIIEIGGGIICFLMVVSSFVLQDVSTTTFQLLFLGVAILLYGLSNNNTDKSKRGKMMSAIASVCIIISAIISFYGYYHHK